VKISLERDAFLSQLQTVTRVASTRSAIQALSGVQLAAAESTCELRATDTEVSLRVPLDAEVERKGTVILPARLLVGFIAVFARGRSSRSPQRASGRSRRSPRRASIRPIRGCCALQQATARPDW